jgi:hypothetical protein
MQSSVTLFAKRAIGETAPQSLIPQKGDRADFVILHENATLQSAVLNPSWERTVIKGGVTVAHRMASRWLLHNDKQG